MFEPSTWWAPDERQRVVTELTETLKRHASTGKAISGQAAYDWAHRIYLVLNETASFLEKNRDEILHKDLAQS